MLELEAPLKVCGNIHHQAISMANTMTCYGFSKMGDTRQTPTIFSWVTMSTEESTASKPFVCCLHIKSNTRKTSFCYEETMNVPQSTEYMGFMTSAKGDTI
jgi:hypothetical protein